MTGRTGARFDSKVPEGYAGPGNGPVAIVTGHRRRDVRSGFSLHHAVVVARRTTSWRYTIMSKEGRLPIGRAMATITVDSRRQMVDRLDGGDDPPAGGVALHTLRGSSPEDTLHVTPLAHNLRVPPAEREAGAAVIDSDIRTISPLGRRGIRHQQQSAAYHKKPDNNCPGNESMACPASHSSHLCYRHCATISR